MSRGLRHGKGFDSGIRSECGARFFHIKTLRLRLYQQG
jgi:hypothetical protein